MELLQKYGITHIVNLISHKIPSSFPGDFEYLNLKMGDNPGFEVLPSVYLVLAWLEKLDANCNVLVHCRAGRSRSVVASAAYLMYKEGVDEKEAIHRITQLHPESDPNLGFIG